VPVNRGPSLRGTSDAIAAAVVADIEAREQREEDARQRRDEAFRAVIRHPERVALVEPQMVKGRRPE
jgi:hypothetical protein